MERKCPSCGFWNTDNDYCSACNTPLSQDLIRKKAVEEKAKEYANRPPEKLDILMQKMENSRFLLVRIIYRIVYSIWVAFVAVMSFFMWMTAAGPG